LPSVIEAKIAEVEDFLMLAGYNFISTGEKKNQEVEFNRSMPNLKMISYKSEKKLSV
jgi:hypothetical protein